MKLAVVGSRGLKHVIIDAYIPGGVCEIVSGGAAGVDSIAAEYARSAGIILTEFLPQYNVYGRAAPMVRNRRIAEYADAVLALWDGHSRGTKYTVDLFRRLGKPVTLIIVE